ncbi:MCM2/3/5 family protein [Trichuris suis]|nr:MCM2/3/5 family protein [Trichuris suis]
MEGANDLRGKKIEVVTLHDWNKQSTCSGIVCAVDPDSGSVVLLSGDPSSPSCNVTLVPDTSISSVKILSRDLNEQSWLYFRIAICWPDSPRQLIDLKMARRMDNPATKEHCPPDFFIAQCKLYLVRYCFDQIEHLAAADDNESDPVKIVIDVEVFCSHSERLVEQVFRKPDKAVRYFRQALKDLLMLMAKKRLGPVRFSLAAHQINAPFCRQFDDCCSLLGCLITLKGVIAKVSQVRLIQYSRHFVCKRCQFKFVSEASFDRCYCFTLPAICPSGTGCRCTQFEDITPSGAPSLRSCRRYQEAKLQDISGLSSCTLTESIWVVLEESLVESCNLGEQVLVTGVLRRRCHAAKRFQEPLFDIVLRATHVLPSANLRHALPSSDSVAAFEEFWTAWAQKPLSGRNVIVSSFCPTMFQMFLAKLAALLVIIGGVSRTSESGTLLRGDCHLLMVGDPGTGKSQILKFAAGIAPRSIYTTGIGTSNAGLTCHAVKEQGEWQLEAGALPLACGGICCIDEFNTMKEVDKEAIREAMEQQTVSVAKAGLVTKLNCRCSVMAACNFQENVGRTFHHDSTLSTPLLSRFDLVLYFKQANTDKWIRNVCKHLLRSQLRNASRKRQCDDQGGSHEDLWSVAMLKDYVRLVRTLQPSITPDAERVLSQYFLKQRAKSRREEGLTTVRMMDSLVRLSQAHARLMFREEVTILDALVATSLVELTMQGDAFLETPDVVQSVFPENAEEDYARFGLSMLRALDLEGEVQLERSFTSPTDDEKPDDDLGSGDDASAAMSSIERKLKRFRYTESDE